MHRQLPVLLLLASCSRDAVPDGKGDVSVLEPDTDAMDTTDSDVDVDTIDSDSAHTGEPAPVDTDIPDEPDCVPPILAVSPTTFSAPEDAQDDESIGTLSFSPGTTGVRIVDDADGRIWLDVAAWDLRVRGGLDFETEPSVYATVRTEEAACGTYRVFDLRVEVEDVNEPPMVQQPFPLRVSEGTLPSTRVGLARATDHEGGLMTWSLPPSADSRFTITSGGEIFAAGTFDFETEPQLLLDVRVADEDGLEAEGQLTITVDDQNEAPTVTTTQLRIGELAAVDAFVGQLEGVDPEGDPLSWHTSFINRFWVHPDGTVLLRTQLDHETDEVVVLEVTATDPGGATHTALIDVLVDDENEPPTAHSHSYGIQEGPDRSRTMQTLVSDPDDGDQLTILLAQGHDPRFSAIGSDMFFLGDLDYETEPEVTVDYQVVDLAGLTAHGTVTVEVVDANEEPTALPPAPIPENTPVGDIAGQLILMDPEGEIVTADPTTTRPFTVSPDGTLTVNEALDYETQPSVVVSVFLDTPNGPFGYVDLDVPIADVNEPPVISFQEGITWQEDVEVGTTRGQFSATDPEGDPLTWSVTGPFTVQDGSLRLAAPLDYESQPTIDATLRVEDPEGLFAEHVFSFNILDVNEPPVPELGPVSVPELGAATPFHTFVATDPEGDAFTWHVLPPWDAAFAVDGVGGMSVLDPTSLDYETAPSITVSLEVRDVHGANTTFDQLIEVTDVDES